jgi:hypothetical protein
MLMPQNLRDLLEEVAALATMEVAAIKAEKAVVAVAEEVAAVATLATKVAVLKKATTVEMSVLETPFQLNQSQEIHLNHQDHLNHVHPVQQIVSLRRLLHRLVQTVLLIV